MRVGLVEHPPWVVRTSGEPAQLEALEHYQLDVVIGGFTDRTPWRTYVGLTRSYFEETYRVGIPTATSLQDLNGVEVAVHKGEAVAAELENKGARVIRV